ncbi:MAG: hypothetical protein M1371_06795 [Actinobacteria bacterium]|nr:hypothetical protein [Actinomycetota bacterium]
MNKRFILGLIGFVILIIGIFTPIFNLPFTGNLSYFQNSRTDGIIILSLAATSLILLKNYKWLLVTGLGSLAVMIFTL